MITRPSRLLYRDGEERGREIIYLYRWTMAIKSANNSFILFSSWNRGDWPKANSFCSFDYHFMEPPHHHHHRCRQRKKKWRQPQNNHRSRGICAIILLFNNRKEDSFSLVLIITLGQLTSSNSARRLPFFISPAIIIIDWHRRGPSKRSNNLETRRGEEMDWLDRNK